MIRRLFLRISLCALGLTCGLAGASAAADDPSDPCHGGPAGGRWELPDAQNFGHARGVLVRRNGRPAFGLAAAVLQNPHTDRRGRIEGVLHTLPSDGSQPEPIARVIGEYGTPDGIHGRFQALVVRPTPFGNILLGRIKGRFGDPDREENDGRFHGRWVLCRPDGGE